MISITHNGNELSILIVAQSMQHFELLQADVKRRYSEYCLAWKDEPVENFDGKVVCVLWPTVELF